MIGDVEDNGGDAAQQQALLQRQYHALIRAFNELETVEAVEALDLDELETRLERMQSHFWEAERSHMNMPVGVEVNNDDFSAMEARFMQTSAKIKRRIRRLNAIEQASEGRRTPTPAAPTVMRLEAPHVPDVGTFNGDPEAWPPFRNLFLSEVHNRDMDDAKKLKLLKKACIDRAANTLGSWDLESDGYQAAWDRMLHVYNDDYHVVHGLLSRLFAMKRPERESFESMRLIVDTVNGAFRSLKTMSHHPALAEQIWVHIGKRALPTTALDAWEQHRGQLGLRRLPTLAEWTSFCDERSRGSDEMGGQRGISWKAKGGLQQTQSGR